MTAQAKRREGLDVVVGVVETHGRKETEALLEGLEIVPRRRVEYKGRWLEEMDLDAILKRRPQLVLVDELAHTNAPGSRHPKRYMDVEELLGAGIDVYTTLNIQHVESLNDVVARITRIRVRETVPDSIIDRADDIELVDLTPDDLIQRLKEGKVYVPQQAERAVRHYFQPGNLTALRELALRRTAQRVDAADGRLHAGPCDRRPVGGGRARAGLRQRGPELRGGGSLCPAPGRPPARAVGGDPHRNLAHAAADIGRARPHRRMPAARRAPRRRGPDRARSRTWPKACSSTPGPTISPIWSSPSRAARAGRSGCAARSTHQLIRQADDISVHVIAERREPTGRRRETAAPLATRAGATRAIASPNAYLGIGRFRRRGARHRPRPAAVPGGFQHRPRVPDGGARQRHRLRPVAVAVRLPDQRARLQFLLPAAALHLHDRRSRERRRAVLLCRRRGDRQQSDGAGSRPGGYRAPARERPPKTSICSPASSPVRSRSTICCGRPPSRSPRCSRCNVVLLLPEARRVAVRAGYPPEDTLDEADLAAAKWSWENNQPAGRGADTLPGAKRLFLPMHTGRGPVGIVGLDSDRPGPLLTPDQRRLLQCARRSGRAGDRAHRSGAGCRAGAPRGRDREAALRAAHLDIARSAHAAGLGPGLGDEPQELSPHARRCRTGRADRHDPGGSRAAQPLHRQPARYDPARSRRGAAADPT